ncbi:P-type conjugative transfer ATPase TrbB [Acetobacteraceae bacterium]|nr:P-type conjugative transfer ATPase TrbB [Acetobacteraceae bacterium]
MPNRETKQRDTIERLKRRCGELILDPLDNPNVTDIMLNPDGNLFIEGFGIEKSIVGKISPLNAKIIVDLVASYHGKIVNDRYPKLECNFPLDDSRFEGVYPPYVRNATFALRKKPTKIFTLEDYIQNGGITQRQSEVLKEAIRGENNGRDKKSIIVVGGTGSGKTTFLNALLHAVSSLTPEDRIITMEERSYELQISSEDKVQMYAEKEGGLEELLRISLRLNPSRLIVGEVRDGAALGLLKALNTGHPGGFSTIHADSALLGLSKLVSYVSENQNAPRFIEPMIAEAVNLVVFMEKTSKGIRRVNEIIRVNKWDRQAQEFLTTPIA